jgi:hypothetical protein
VTFIAFLFSFSSHLTLTLIASLLSFVAALLTLIAFLIDIALYTVVRNKVRNLDGVQARSVAAPGTTTPPLSPFGKINTWVWQGSGSRSLR